jgi:hypothetical protein
LQLTTFSNGVAERWVGSVRRDLLDHVIPLNQRHLRRLLAEYIRYYHDDRTHLGDLRNILPPLEPERSTHQQEAAWSRYPDWADCITATPWQLKAATHRT